MDIIVKNNCFSNHIDNNLRITNNSITFYKSGEYNIIISNSKHLDINIELMNDVFVKLFIVGRDCDIKIKSIYNLNKNSSLKIFKFYSNLNTFEEEIINLNEENTCFSENFSSISSLNEDYHIVINHNNSYTSSYISNRCIGCKGSNINFVIDSKLPKGNINCAMDQTTKILTLGEVNAKIEPNMFIDEDSVDARHGSVIGTFRDEDVFYLMSRGIDEKSAIDLLLKGFIFSNLELNMDNKAMIYECIKDIGR